MKNKTFLFPALAALAALSIASEATAQGQVCSDIAELVERSIPNGVGDPAVMKQLLAPPIGPQFSDVFLQIGAQSALPAVQSRLRIGRRGCTADELGEVTCRVSNFRKTEFLKFEQRTGKAAYLNQLREWSPKSGGNDLPDGQAVELAQKVVDAWGIPVAELDRQFAEVRSLNLAGGEKLDGTPSEIVRTEVHVRFPRRIGGVPVFDSDVRFAFDGRGRVARLRVKWPSFALLPGLEPTPISREDVAVSAAEELSEGALCGSLSKVDAHIAYVDAKELPSFDPSDEGDVEAAHESGEFVPALVVYAYGREPKEDSGELALGGRQIVVPLLEVRGDGGN